jgi:hypothetical protein
VQMYYDIGLFNDIPCDYYYLATCKISSENDTTDLRVYCSAPFSFAKYDSVLCKLALNENDCFTSDYSLVNITCPNGYSIREFDGYLYNECSSHQFGCNLYLMNFIYNTNFKFFFTIGISIWIS